ncbi:MAG: hypothetical protein WD801_15065 [Gemmatimonadaceae bacterium]
MSELNPVRARFFAGIAAEVNPERIAEVHLFQPIKQGCLESGVAVVAVDEAPSAENRLAVHTATYRLTLKGPDRGKWEFAMHAEADAPLVTVDVVVRGVQRRSGDEQEPEKLSGEEFRALLPLREPTPATPTP